MSSLRRLQGLDVRRIYSAHGPVIEDGPGRIADYIAHLTTLAFCLFMVYATGQQAIRGLSDDTELSTLPLRVGPAYSFVLAGFLALTVILLVDLARVRRGQSMLLSQEAPSAT